MRRRHPTALAVLALAMAPMPALAHHPMGGEAPAHAWQGVLSGIAHPVIGLDHLAFLVAAGLLAATMRQRAAVGVLLAFLAAGLTGAVLHLAGLGLGPVEAMVALSVLLAGVALLAAPARPRGGAPAWLALGFALAGLFHGHAYAEAVTGSGPGTILAYLLTLAVMQAAIGLGAMAAARQFGAASQRRWAGMAAALAGVVALGSAVLA